MLWCSNVGKHPDLSASRGVAYPLPAVPATEGLKIKEDSKAPKVARVVDEDQGLVAVVGVLGAVLEGFWLAQAISEDPRAPRFWSA